MITDLIKEASLEEKFRKDAKNNELKKFLKEVSKLVNRWD